MTRSVVLAAGMLPASHIAASAQKTSVQSLLNGGYTIAGVTTSQTGGGLLYLQKGSTLMHCYVTETPRSTPVDTQYCKPVK
jgi:hypothetical protein